MPVFPILNIKTNFTGIGLRYDSGLLVITEVTQEKNEGAGSADLISGYLTLGYRFDQFLPYINIARQFSTDDNLRKDNITLATLANRQRNAYSVGVKYYLSSSIALKADVTYADAFGNTTGGFPPAGNFNKANQSVTVYSLAVDAIF